MHVDVKDQVCMWMGRTRCACGCEGPGVHVDVKTQVCVCVYVKDQVCMWM